MTFKTSDVTSGTRDVNAHVLFPVVEACRECVINGHSVVTKLRVLIGCFLFPTTVLSFVQEVTKRFWNSEKKVRWKLLGKPIKCKVERGKYWKTLTEHSISTDINSCWMNMFDRWAAALESFRILVQLPAKTFLLWIDIPQYLPKHLLKFKKRFFFVDL